MYKPDAGIEIWTRHNAWAMLGATMIFAAFESSVAFLAAAMSSFFIFILRSRHVWAQYGWWGGWANVTTALRLILTALLVSLYAALHPYLIFALGILILVADGLDGYLARKYNTVSVFGDCFDKETDAFFVLAFGVIICQKHLAGEWVLLPGLLRYMYVILLAVMKVKQKAAKPSFRRQLAGMWLMGTLLACFIVTDLVYIPALVLAIILVFFSFAKDLYSMLVQPKEKVPH